jgi:hypothetical protein
MYPGRQRLGGLRPGGLALAAGHGHGVTPAANPRIYWKTVADKPRRT